MTVGNDRLPGLQPLLGSPTRPSTTRASPVMVRSSTVWSGFTTNTYWALLAGLHRSGWARRSRRGSIVSVTDTLTNCPGQRCRVWFGNVPLIRMVPVVGSTGLSTNVIRPIDGCPRDQVGGRVDLHRPRAMYRFKSGRRASGMPNDT